MCPSASSTPRAVARPPRAAPASGDLGRLDGEEVFGFDMKVRRHPVARFWFAQMRDGSTEDLLLALDGCDRRLGRLLQTEKQEQAFHSLKAYVDAEGRFPAATRYEEWRGADASRAHLKSMTFIRNAFGTWPEARAAFESAPTFNVLGQRILAQGSAHAEEVLRALLQSWSASVDGPLYCAASKRGSAQTHLGGPAFRHGPKACTRSGGMCLRRGAGCSTRPATRTAPAAAAAPGTLQRRRRQ